jgi:hypothetical protein
MKYKIGDLVIDEDGNMGIVVIHYDDGDSCSIENDAAHPNPKIIVDRSIEAEYIKKITG